MCGICGFVGYRKEAVLLKMMQAIAHRGPDQRGHYYNHHVGLGHLRLSIIDLSERGRQPMTNEDGTILLVHNGEIYNFTELKKRLGARGHVFTTNSDSEVIVHAYEEYGLDCIRHFRGMFAFAIWDANLQKLCLARDRLGIKPLYYTIQAGCCLFASEIKALLVDPTIKRHVDQCAYLEYLTFQYIASNTTTIFEGICKLPAGHLLIFQDGELCLQQYWDVADFSTRPQVEPQHVVVNTVREMLAESVKIRLMSDVPVGILLSGGLDSSSIVGLASKFSQSPVKTFSVGFGQPDDELPYARQVAEHFKTNHHEFTFGPHDLTKTLHKIVYHCDEPIADGGLLATYWVSEYVRQYVTVILVGEGADELFGGYPWHRLSTPYLGLLPRSLKRDLFIYLTSYYRARDLTSRLKQAWREIRKYHVESLTLPQTGDFLRQLQTFEFEQQLPNHLLMKVDKMTMAHSIEARVPYLDHHLVEYVLSLPSKYKLHGLTGKYILRQAVSSFMPKEIVRRKKRGFMLPIDRWLRSDLKSMALGLLTSAHSHTRQTFEPSQIEDLFQPAKNRLIDVEKTALLWRLLVFEIWYQLYIHGDAWA